MQSSITQGWIVDGLRVINLTADNITANTIFTNTFYLGSDGNGSIAMSGDTTQIIIKDLNGTDRIILGDLDSSITGWGGKFLDSTGTVKFQVGATTFIDGAIITNATITGGKIANATITGGNIGSNTVANGNIASGLSASKVTTGTLTVSSATVAIDVTSGGAVLLRNGADLIFRASTSNTNYCSFQNSSASDRGFIGYTPSSNTFFIDSNSATMQLGSNNGDMDIICGSGDMNLVCVDSNGDIILNSGSSGTVDVTSTLRMEEVRPLADNIYDLGSASFRFADVRSVLINGADFCFEGFPGYAGCRFTEAHHVYSDAKPEDGVFLMNSNWMPVAQFTESGHIIAAGAIERNWVFPPPDIPRRESKNDKESRL